MLFSKGRTLLITGGIAFAILLFVAPRTAEDQGTGEQKEQDEVGRELDQALHMIKEGERPMKGILELRSVAEKYPDDPRPQWHLGIFSLETGQHRKAIQRFEKVLELDENGDYPDANFYLGRAFYAASQPKKAQNALETYLEVGKQKELMQKAEKMLQQSSAIQ